MNIIYCRVPSQEMSDCLFLRLGLVGLGGVLLASVLAWYVWQRRTAPSASDTIPMS
jgi:hypothetical protein